MLPSDDPRWHRITEIFVSDGHYCATDGWIAVRTLKKFDVANSDTTIPISTLNFLPTGNSVGIGVGASAPVGEHIHRHCKLCHYDWIEAPLDAANKEQGDAK